MIEYSPKIAPKRRKYLHKIPNCVCIECASACAFKNELAFAHSMHTQFGMCRYL